MGALPGWLLVHQVFVEPFEGEGPFGPEYGSQVPVRCFLDESRRYVRDATGTQVIAEATFHAPLATVCPPGSRVTLPSGRQTTAITSARRDGGGLPTPDHLEVTLQ